MASPFFLTARALRDDARRAGLSWAIVAALLLAGWFAWLGLASLPVLAVSRDARIAPRGDVFRIPGPPDAARIESIPVRLGDPVAAGDLLAQFDAGEIDPRLEAERERLAVIGQRIERKRSERARLQAALFELERATRRAEASFDARIREASIRAEALGDEAARVQALEREGIVSPAQRAVVVLESETAVAQRTARIEEAAERTAFLELQRSDRLAQIDRVAAELSDLAAERAEIRSSVDELEYRRSQYTVRSPFGGSVGELTQLRSGQRVAPLQILGAIVPEGENHIVARFEPGSLAGRIRAGQPARFRLDAFPSIEFGSWPGHVRRVGLDPEGRLIEVEVEIDTPLPHDGRFGGRGATGQLEIVVDRRSPLSLAIRGMLLAGRAGERS